MEMCDVLDASGTRTGRTVARGTKLADGEYYLVVQIWIRSESGEYLIQRRALDHTSAPGMWATTAGQVLAGEESIPGAIREVNEELGLQLSPAPFKRFDRLAQNNLMQDIWLVEVSQDSIGTPEMGTEVMAWKWASKNEIRQMIKQGEFFAYSYFDQLPD